MILDEDDDEERTEDGEPDELGGAGARTATASARQGDEGRDLEADLGPGADIGGEADRWLDEQLRSAGVLEVVNRALAGVPGPVTSAQPRHRPFPPEQIGEDDEDHLEQGLGPAPHRRLEQEDQQARWPEAHDRFAAGAKPVPAAWDFLPFRCPEGYFRETGTRARWRYTLTGELVPGAVDLTLERLWSFERDAAGHVAVPLRLAVPELASEQVEQRRFWAEELAWARTWLDEHRDLLPPARGRPAAVPVVWVPRWEWEARARRAIGLWAPELDLSRLLDVDSAGALLGITRSAVTSYLSRGRFPEPAAVKGNSPLWTLPVLLQWADRRPGQGRRGTLQTAKRRSRRRPPPDVEAFLSSFKDGGRPGASSRRPPEETPGSHAASRDDQTP